MLSEEDKVHIGRLVDDEKMVDALSHYVSNFVAEQQVNVLPTDTNEILGQKTRALAGFNELLDKALISMRQYKGRKSIKNQTNLER